MSSTQFVVRQTNGEEEANSILQHKLGGDDGSQNIAKTPRRGLGMIINSTKTPVNTNLFSQPSNQQFSLSKSVRKPVFEDFVVYEDKVNELEPELQKLELVEESETIGMGCSSPVERASRVSIGHDSIRMGVEERNQEFVSLKDDDQLVENNLDISTQSDESIAILGEQIEIASRIDTYIEDIRFWNNLDSTELTNEEYEEANNSSDDEFFWNSSPVLFDHFCYGEDESEEDEEEALRE